MITRLSTALLLLLSWAALDCAAAGSSIYAPLLSSRSGKDSLLTLASWESSGTTGGGKLYSYLRAADPLIRLRAVEVLGRIGEKRSIPYLIKLLSDRDPRVARASIFALGIMHAENAVGPLLSASRAGELETKCTIADALGRIGGEEAVSKLKEWLQDFDSNVRVCAATALGRTGRPEAASALLIALHDPDPRVLERSILALGSFRTARAAKGILPLLEHESPRVRAAAARSLRWMEEKSASRILPKLLVDDDYAVVIQAAKALGRFGEKRAVSRLGAVVRKHPLAHVRMEALKALERIGGTGVEDYIIEALSDRSRGMRMGAVGALARLMGKDAEMFLAMVLEDGDRFVRAAALESIGMAGCCDKLEDFIEKAGHRKDPMMQRAAAAARRMCEEYTEAQEQIGEKKMEETIPEARPAEISPPLPSGTHPCTIVTEKGTMEAELFGDDAPWHVAIVREALQSTGTNQLHFDTVIPDSVLVWEIPMAPSWPIPRRELSRMHCREGAIFAAGVDSTQETLRLAIALSYHPNLDGRVTIVGRITGGFELCRKIEPGEEFSAKLP